MRQVSSVASSYSLAGLAALRSPLAASMVLADYFDETRPVEAAVRHAWQMHAASGGAQRMLRRAALPAVELALAAVELALPGSVHPHACARRTLWARE